MSGLFAFHGLQKLRFFLAGLLPFLARAPRLPATPWLQRHPRVARWWKVLDDSAVAANARRVAATFAVGHYGDRHLEWSKIPGESAAILRSVIVLGTLLCVLVPVAVQVAWPPLSVEEITGVAGAPVAGWSVWLWIIAFALGWSCVLGGTAAASRVVFLPALGVFFYFGIVTVAALPKTWWNLLLPLPGALAVVYSETCRTRVRRRDFVVGLFSAIVGCVAVVFAAIVVTPLTARFRGQLLSSAIDFAWPLGVLLWLLAGKLRRRALIGERASRLVRLDVVVGLLAAVYLALLVTLVVRGGLVPPAQGIHTFAISVTGYLWPFYYFIGIGVVFKVLRQTRTVHAAAFELIPARFFVPFCMLLLVTGSAIGWSEFVVARPNLPLPDWLGSGAQQVYVASRWLWARPLLGLTMEPMKWVLLAASIIALWGLIRRRFDSGVAAGLLFVVLLLWLATFEYYFEFTGFTRSYRHTALSLLFFSAFVLWVTHRTMLDFLVGSSRWWPGAARVAVYAATLLFVLMPVHARAATHDARLPNEVFLFLFFGVVNLGLPYYLYVYVQRRFTRLPLSVPAMLAMFGLGAIVSVPLIILDKLSLAAWSALELWTRTTATTAALLQGQPPANEQVFLAPEWILLRGGLAIAAVCLVAALARRVSRDVRLAPAAAMLGAVAAGAGIAALSNRSLELPLLPVRISQLVAPLYSSVAVDATLIARQLSYVVPAMIIGLVFSAQRHGLKQVLGIAAAFTAHVVIALLWPRQEALLRSTGVLALAGAAGIVLFLWLAGLSRERLDALLEPNAADTSRSSAAVRLLLTPDLHRSYAVLLLLLSGGIAYSAYSRRLVTHRLDSSAAARLPRLWRLLDSASTPGALALGASSYSAVAPKLWAESRPLQSGEERALLQQIAMETAQRLAHYAPMGLEKWNRFHPGALALDFSYAMAPGDSSASALGTTALALLPNGEALIATVTYGPSDANRRWDLARAFLALPRSPPATPDTAVSGRDRGFTTRKNGH